MCICCCFCNCCNSYSSKCVEISILVLSTITFVCSIFGLVFIKSSHLTTVGFSLLIILIAFSAIITIGAICILIFRYKNKINKDKNLFSTILAILGLCLTIGILLISLVAESLVQTNFKDIDYPCKDIPYNSQATGIVKIRLLDTLTYEQKVEFCKNKNINYNANICSNLEYTMTYLSSTIIECCALVLIFFWYNDLRRIKEKIDGELPIYDSSYINRERLEAQGINFKDIEQIEPSDRYLNQNQLVQSRVVLVKNNNNKYQRNSQPIDLNNKPSTNKNFIRDLRKEMKEAIESLEEESSENKDDYIEREKEKQKEKEKEKEKFDDILYSDKSSNSEKNKDKNIDINNDKDKDKKENSNVIVIDEEENKEEKKEEKIEENKEEKKEEKKEESKELDDLSKDITVFEMNNKKEINIPIKDEKFDIII